MTTSVESTTDKSISAAGQPLSSCGEPLFRPPALTLSIGGVDFTLTPSNDDGVVSYRHASNGGVFLDLAAFTGSLKVAAVSQPNKPCRPTTMVEEEPNSPTIALEKVTEVSPSQKKLPFTKVKKGDIKKSTSKLDVFSKKQDDVNHNKSRKRDTTNSTVEPIEPKKSKTLLEPSRKEIPQLFQNSQPEYSSSYTQETHFADLSQTMDSASTSNQGSSTSGEDGNIAYQMKDTSLGDKHRVSVQEILDRVNAPSGDSVATVPHDDENSAAESTRSEPSAARLDGIDEKPETMTSSSAMINKDDNVNDVTENDGSTFKGFKPPIARWGHTMTRVRSPSGKDDQILIFGGQSFDKDGFPIMLDDVHVYDTTKKQWDKPINCADIARQWHSANFLPERQLLITFGGETLDPIKKSKVITTDSLRVLDTDIMLWYPPAVSGSIPAARSGHTATVIPNSQELVVFGGVKGSKWLNTVSVLDTVRWIWSTPKIEGSAPKPRSYHCAIAVKTKDAEHYKLVIFGGNNKSTCFNSVHVLEMNGNNWCWKHPTVSGVAPFPRTGACATLMEDGNTICIYGGWDPNGDEEDENMFKGSYFLDCESWAWRVGPKPIFAGSGCEFAVDNCGSKRAGHTSVLEGGSVLVFGGRTPGERLASDFQKLSPTEQLVGLDG